MSTASQSCIGGPDQAAIRAELTRVLSSPTFADADRLCRFLSFVVEEALAGRAGVLKESVVGTEVFARDAGYDPKADPIVRVQARRLRTKLDIYYTAAADRQSRLRITLPKGGYAPEFITAAEGPPAGQIPSPKPRSHVALVWLAAALALCVAVAVVLLLNRQPERPASTRLFTSLPGYQTTPAFSPDGNAIAFGWGGPTSDNEDIYLQRIDADSPTRLTTAPESDTRPVWLPDGRHIGFMRVETADRAAIMVMNADGSEQRRLAAVAIVSRTAPRVDWPPDSSSVYTSEPAAPGRPLRIVEIDLSSGQHRALTEPSDASPGDDEATVSPDGRFLAFRRRSEASIDDVWVVPRAGGAARPITTDHAGVVGIAWTRDNRALIVSSRRAGSLQQLWRFPVGGGKPVVLTEAYSAASYPAVSPSGTRIVYSSRFLDTNIWRVDLEGGTPAQRLISSNLLDSSPHYSPDGHRIAFRSNRTGNDELWVANGDGSAPRRLTNFGGPVTGDGRWSPDGQSLVVSARVAGHADVFVVAASGGNVSQLTRDASNHVLPSFSPDGKSVFYASDRTGDWQIWRESVPGGDAKQVTQHGGFSPLFSADGRWLFYTKMPGGGVFRMPADAGGETKVVETLPAPLWGSWAPGAADTLVYVRDKPAGLEVLDLTAGKSRIAATLNFPAVTWDGALGVSPDGKYALVSEVERAGSEIRLMDAR